MICVLITGDGNDAFAPLAAVTKSVSFLPLNKDTNVLKHCFSVLNTVFPADKIYIVCSIEQYEEVVRSATGIKEENIIVEPSKKIFSVSLYYATLVLGRIMPDELLFFFRADQLFMPDPKVVHWIAACENSARTDKLVYPIVFCDKEETPEEYIEAGKISVFTRNQDVFTIERIVTGNGDIKKRKIFGKQGKIVYIVSGKIAVFKERFGMIDNRFFRALDKVLAEKSVVWDAIIEVYSAYQIDKNEGSLFEFSKSDLCIFVESPLIPLKNWSQFMGYQTANGVANFAIGKVEFTDCRECVVVNEDPETVRIAHLTRGIIHKKNGEVNVTGY